jgi:hypothetical protein
LMLWPCYVREEDSRFQDSKSQGFRCQAQSLYLP